MDVELDEDELKTMIQTYQESGDKEWLTAAVTIDGEAFRDAGMRLKGNSSLRSVDSDTDAADLPWLIDLGKYVDGLSIDGWERFVVRSNNSATALNEGVALDLLREAGLASQESVAIRFSVNGSDAQLRLLVQDLDNKWDEATFGTEGTLYKSEAGGDWSYRGENPDSYTDIFDIEAGSEDFAPLTAFLKWLDESSDGEFASGLANWLDVGAFATYLAFEDLIGNGDDIDGPGNNSYLRWDAEAERMTVVAWDHNLAFGGMGRMGLGMRNGGGEPPDGFEAPDDVPERMPADLPEDMPGGDRWEGGLMVGGMRGGNVLSARFREDSNLSARYDEAVERLKTELFDDGTADEVLDARTAILEDHATDLVEASTISDEAEQVSSYFDGHAAGQ